MRLKRNFLDLNIQHKSPTWPNNFKNDPKMWKNGLLKWRIYPFFFFFVRLYLPSNLLKLKYTQILLNINIWYKLTKSKILFFPFKKLAKNTQKASFNERLSFSYWKIPNYNDKMLKIKQLFQPICWRNFTKKANLMYWGFILNKPFLKLKLVINVRWCLFLQDFLPKYSK